MTVRIWAFITSGLIVLGLSSVGLTILYDYMITNPETAAALITFCAGVLIIVIFALIWVNV